MKKTFSIVIALALALAFSLVLTAPVAADPGTTYYVSITGSDETGTGSWWNPWKTIQHAVDTVAAGDTIIVAPGTYVEIGQIVISIDLTITGTDKETTIIKPAQDTGSSGDSRGWFLVQAGTEFNLSSVTLDGSGKKVYQAIRDKGSGTITNCDFDNIQFNPSGPTYNGMAVAATGNVDVNGCTFTAIGRVGVLYFGTGVTGAAFSNNTYTGKGSGDWLDYGVEVGAGATATITGNTITSCTGVASSDGSVSAGILVTDYYGSGTTATTTGNTLTNNTIGIAVGYDDTDLSVATISGNTFDDNAYQVDCTSSVDVDLEETLANNTFDRAVVVRGSGIKVPTIFSSIQDAIDAAVAGDTVEVAAGTYDLTAPIVVDKSLTLTGNTTAPSNVIINAPTGITDMDCLQVKANNVTIQGFKIQGAKDADGGTGYQNAAVMIGTHWDGSPIVGLHDINISYNEITDCTRGIYVYRAQNVTISDNVIHDIVFAGANAGAAWPGKGIELRGDGAPTATQCNSIDILDNEIYNCELLGIEINLWEMSPDTPFVDIHTTIDGNTIYNNGGEWDEVGYPGVYVYRGISCNGQTTGVTISNNEIYDHTSETNTPHSSSGGIRIEDDKEYTVTDNDIHDNYNGIVLTKYDYASLADFVIDSNDFQSNTIQVNDQAEALVIEDVLANNTFDRAVTVDHPGASLLHTIWSSIQDAVDAASARDTVQVAAGTYAHTGQIVIDKDLTIIGENKETTTIEPASGFTDSYLFRINDGEVDLSGFTFDGKGSLYGGVRYTAPGTGALSNNIFKNIVYPGYDGIGVVVYADNVTVSNSAFTNIGRIGIWVGGDNALVTGNTYTGKGAIDCLDYGIEVGFGGVATITDNTITNCLGVASSDNSTSAGILVTDYYGSGTEATITGNTLTGNTYGIGVGFLDTDASVVEANYNNISGNTHGIDQVGAVEVDATANWWGDASGPYHATTNLSGTGNDVSDNVDYSPWWGANYIGVAHPWEWYTNDSIQDAIDAASAGDTVNVSEGTYDEYVDINKSLTLSGESGAIVAPSTSSDEPMIAINANGVTVEGFEVDGSSDSGEVWAGIGSWSGCTNVTIKGNTVHDIANGSDSGLGIGLWRCDGNIYEDILIEGNTVYNTDRMGIYIGAMLSDFSGWYLSSSTIKDNTVHDAMLNPNAGETYPGGCGGIAVDGAKNTTIEGNTVYDTASTMPGIYLTHGSGPGNQIVENEVYGQAYGIGVEIDRGDVTFDGVSPTAPEVHYNNIHDNGQRGLDAFNVSGMTVDATYNWWGNVTGPYHETENPDGLGNAVSDNVDFEPWFGDEEMTTLEPRSTYLFDYTVPEVIVAGQDTEIPVTFETDELGYSGYDGVRFEFGATGPGNVTFKATDSEEVEHTFVNSGYWGPPAGFNLPAEYTATTDWTLNFSEPGEYTVTFSLVEAPDGDVIAGIEGSEVITVRAEDILDHYRHLHAPYDEVTTDDLLDAIDDWLADVVPPGFEEPISTLQLLELIDEWLAS